MLFFEKKIFFVAVLDSHWCTEAQENFFISFLIDNTVQS